MYIDPPLTFVLDYFKSLLICILYVLCTYLNIFTDRWSCDHFTPLVSCMEQDMLTFLKHSSCLWYPIECYKNSSAWKQCATLEQCDKVTWKQCATLDQCDKVTWKHCATLDQCDKVTWKHCATLDQCDKVTWKHCATLDQCDKVAIHVKIVLSFVF
jgi:hypothetical protein